MSKSTFTGIQGESPKKKKSTLRKELYASEIRYRRLFETAQDGILILDAETGQIVDVNPFLIDLLGYSKSEFIEKSVWEIGAFQDIIENKDKFFELQQKEYVRYEDLPLETSDGSKIHVEFVSNVYLVENNKVIQCQIRDITARKKAEAVFEKTGKELAEIKKTADEINKFTENILNTVREPLLVIDKKLRVIKASRSFYNFFKVTSSETIGKLIYELGNHQWDIPKLKDLLEKILPEKNSFDNYEVEHNFSTIGKRVMLLNARQVKRAFGKEQVILLAIEDITERKGKEESLKEKHRSTSEFLNILLNHLHTPIIIWDTSMIIKRFNRQFELLSGYSSAEVIDKKINFLFPIEKIEQTLELLKNHLDGEQDDIEIEIVTKNNIIKTVLWNSSRILDEEGKNIIATISQDITSRRQSELALRKSESHLRTLVKTIPDLIWLKDTNGVYLSCNPMFEHFFGARETEIIGKTDYDFVDQELADLFRENDRKAMKAGKPTCNEEWITYANDGHRVFLDTIKTPMYDFNGKLIGVLGIGRDNTQPKLAEQKVRASEKRFRAIFDQAPIAIALVDLQGHPILSNVRLAKMLGYSKEELAKMMFTEFTHPEDIDKDLNQFTDLIAGKISGYSMEKRFIHKNKNIIWANLFITALNDNNDVPQEITGMAEDITERKQAEQEIAMLAHSLKSISECVSITDLENKILFVNESFLKTYGYELNELIGKDISIVRSKNNEQAQLDEILPTTLQGEWHGELMNRKKDGTEFPVYLSTTMIKVQENKVLGLIGVAYDITERKKNHNEIKFQADLINNVGQAIMATDLEGTVIYWNNAAEKIYGWSPSEAIGQNIMDLTPARQTKEQAIEIMQKLGEGKTWTGEFHVKRKDGSSFPAFVTDTPMLDSNGELTGIIGISSDITERKLAEKQIIDAKERAEESEEKNKDMHNLLSNFIKHSPIYSFIKFVEPNLSKVVYASDNYLDMIGINASEMIDKTMYELFPHELAKKITSDDWEVINNGKILVLDEDLNDKNYTTIKFPIVSENKQFLAGFTIDITERKRNEIELIKAKEKAEESEQRFRSLIENAPDGVVIFNESGKIIYVSPNAARLFGYSVNDVIGHSGDEFTHPDDLPLVLKTIETIFNNPLQKPIVNYRFRRKNGEYRWIETTFTNLLSDKAIHGIILNFSDVTERRQILEDLVTAKDKAEESDRLKSAFLANMSHEIRTPMNGILGFTNLLRESNNSPAERNEYFQIIQDSGDRLLNTVEDIMEISRIETNQITLSIEKINISDHLKNLTIFFEPEYKKKNLVLYIEDNLQEHEKIIYTDKTKLDSILTNLLKNAIKFTYKGHISVSLHKTENLLNIAVKDTGIGIPDDKLEVIFDRFVQAEMGLTRGYEGTGLGLSIAKSYATLLEGSLSVKSELGKGSTFYFSIPCNHNNQISVNYRKTPLNNESDIPENLKILIVEDDHSAGILLKMMFKNKCKELFFAKNGIEAITNMKEYPGINLILMDLKMPGMDGYEASGKIKQINNNVKIIAQTAFALKGDKEKALAAGCDEYITKPINKKQLFSLINKCFS